MGLVTGSHARTPRAHGIRAAGCKCSHPQSAQISGQLPPITSDLDHFRRSIYLPLPKFVPEQFLYIMDTPDSFLVSVAAKMVPFR